MGLENGPAGLDEQPCTLQHAQDTHHTIMSIYSMQMVDTRTGDGRTIWHIDWSFHYGWPK
ncbi:hypothetical protein PUNSTDRAFT_56219 [Punctularia strigosozonata HHB-11173 SS5]|uniref:Uncharacterized protein n=1 Tax=Punctularia strigosozonata (strain HHB-11173) TaxID=741275 RepID=R7S250_PUNST|nr:uncharacterized protein PUNSTDRAFT_56219 [Punctularia strigosozonata HHB-11173 SS5]EIN03321.1 hypothetical protein PUNSTDRAFT_56219 [Punctularia strigosozonata HHB-11173 SS5]